MLRNRDVPDLALRPRPGSNRMQGAVAGLSRRIFGTLAAGMSGVDALDNEWNVHSRTQRDAVPFKIVGSGLKPVMDMYGNHLSRPPDGAGYKQCRGISAAAQRNREGQAG